MPALRYAMSLASGFFSNSVASMMPAHHRKSVSRSPPIRFSKKFQSVANRFRDIRSCLPVYKNQHLCLYGNVKFTQGIIQACLQVGRRFTLADDQCAAYLVLARGEFFGIAARYH